MNKITIWRERMNVGWIIRKGKRNKIWEELTRKEQLEIIENMERVHWFLCDHIKEENKQKSN